MAAWPRCTFVVDQTARRQLRGLLVSLAALLPVVWVGAAQAQGDYTVSSPDGSLTATVTADAGNLSYAISRNGAVLISDSALSIRDAVAHTVTSSATELNDSTWEPTWGQFSSIRDHHNRLTLNLDLDGTSFALIFQVYDDGLPSDPLTPLVVNAGDDGWFALLESDLFTVEAFDQIRFQLVSGQAAVKSEMESLAVPSGDFVTPWRVVLVGDTPGDLLESTVTVNLAAPLSLADASWVTPGKGLFNWRTLGYVADDDFTYEQNTASVKRLIDFAADNGIEYVQVTDGWFGEIDNGQLISQAEGFSVEETMVHAGAKGVGIILYAARTGGRQVTNTTDEELFQLLHDLGAVGVKHDYGGNNAPFTRAALKSTAQKQMLLNIHANPAALTGGRRTIPNAITRQTGWGQQDGRKAFEPTDFLEMAMVNALLGPFDQINGIYDLNEMPNRLKGSRNPINSTVAGENARVLIVFSGLIKLPDVPEEYDKKADMFEFLREIPSTWDDTRVLHSSLPNYITTARRSASEWFVCSATNESARTLSIPLDFLDANVSYDVTYYEDDHDGSSPTHYINNRETYQVRTGVVTNSHTVSAVMVAGGGHCMWIRPAGTLALSVAPLTGDDTINGTEQASGFEIGGDTGSQEGVEVTVILGGRKLATVTSAGAPTASWAAAVPADAAYLAESEVGVSVSARLGTASSNPVARSIAVDLTPPSAVSWTASARLTVGEAIGLMSPLGSIDTDAAFDSSSLPAGLTIDRLTGVISGTPSVADPAGRTATVAIVDDAGNATTVEVAFPRVEADEQTNSAPEITTMGPFSVNEGAIFVATLTASDDETVQADLIWSIPAGTDGGADASSFTLSQAGVLAFTAAKDYETPDDADTDRTYDVTVEVSDGTDSDMAELLVTLLNVTELTAITGPESVTFPENSWSRVATFTASSEEDRAGIEWILVGTDSDHFSIDNPPGALRFALQAVAPRIFPEPPDFEAPVDPDAANTYELTLLAKAGSSVTDASFTVTVTVTDVDEEGALSLSATRPALGAALTAVLTDPDGVTAGTALWQWERSTGRNSWAVIDGAAAASYTPVAADTNTFLRVTATYDDEHGTGKTVSEVVPNVVTGPLLTGLTAETDDSQAETARGLFPAFDPQTLHYGIGCNGTDTLVLTVSAAANARVGVAGVQAAGAPMAVDVSEDSDVAIRVTDASGAGTTYVVHCLPEVFFDIETHTFPNTDAFEDLILFKREGYLRLMDRNGVPRLHLGFGAFSSPSGSTGSAPTVHTATDFGLERRLHHPGRGLRGGRRRREDSDPVDPTRHSRLPDSGGRQLPPHVMGTGDARLQRYRSALSRRGRCLLRRRPGLSVPDRHARAASRLDLELLGQHGHRGLRAAPLPRDALDRSRHEESQWRLCAHQRDAHGRRRPRRLDAGLLEGAGHRRRTRRYPGGRALADGPHQPERRGMGGAGHRPAATGLHQRSRRRVLRAAHGALPAQRQRLSVRQRRGVRDRSVDLRGVGARGV